MTKGDRGLDRAERALRKIHTTLSFYQRGNFKEVLGMTHGLQINQKQESGQAGTRCRPLPYVPQTTQPLPVTGSVDDRSPCHCSSPVLASPFVRGSSPRKVWCAHLCYTHRTQPQTRQVTGQSMAMPLPPPPCPHHPAVIYIESVPCPWAGPCVRLGPFTCPSPVWVIREDWAQRDGGDINR